MQIIMCIKNVISVVPTGNIQMGIETEGEAKHFNEKFMSGLGDLKDIKAEDILPTKEDDAYAQEQIDNQNIAALLCAATDDYQWLSDGLFSQRLNAGSSETRPADGSPVKFTYRSELRDGVVKFTSSTHAEVEFIDGANTETTSIPLTDIHRSNKASAPEAVQADANVSSSPNAQMFGGDRHRFEPCTTSIASVLTNLSSKNFDTAHQILQDLINQHGEEEFNKAVHVVVADQEFSPVIFSEFFSHLTADKQLPILPALAIGHAMKNVSTTMMSYYECFFDPMLEAMGVKVGSPEHAKYYKGSEIRKTNGLVANFTEMLALAAAHKYLTEVGNKCF